VAVIKKLGTALVERTAARYAARFVGVRVITSLAGRVIGIVLNPYVMIGWMIVETAMFLFYAEEMAHQIEFTRNKDEALENLQEAEGGLYVALQAYQKDAKEENRHAVELRANEVERAWDSWRSFWLWEIESQRALHAKDLDSLANSYSKYVSYLTWMSRGARFDDVFLAANQGKWHSGWNDGGLGKAFFFKAVVEQLWSSLCGPKPADAIEDPFKLLWLWEIGSPKVVPFSLAHQIEKESKGTARIFVEISVW
jgi:hypothetical protein